jgi:site-specific DNA-cytosine methylase
MAYMVQLAEQIGNSVPVRTARALVRTLLEKYAKN